MQALKSVSIFRPASRSSSPAPITVPAQPPSHLDSLVGLENTIPLARPTSKGPLNRLTLISRKRPASASTPPPTPTLVQDGSYLEALSLKLSEAVSKALVQPPGAPQAGESLFNGRRALPSGRGSALGALIASELEASASNSHLHRAIIRFLHRPLSVLLLNLSAQLLPLLSSPQFTAHPSPSTPSTAQIHAVSYAIFAAELLEVFDVRGLGQVENGNGVATDNLRGIHNGLESVIARVINPLMHAIKKEIDPLLESLNETSSIPHASSSPGYAKQGSSHPKGTRVPLHPSIVALQRLIPLHAKNLTKYVTPPTRTSQAILGTLLISFIWRGLVALSHRPKNHPSNATQPVVSSRPTAPTPNKKYVGNITPPSTTPPSMRFIIKLPPSRPPSPPNATTPTAAGDARALYALLNMLPRPSALSRHALAREAVDEGFGSLTALCGLLDSEVTGDLDAITADLPTVIALPVLLRIFAPHAQNDNCGDTVRSVASLLQVTEEEYRERCLSGFSRAEECGPLIAKRVFESLVGQSDATWDPVVRWLEGRVVLAD